MIAQIVNRNKELQQVSQHSSNTRMSNVLFYSAKSPDNILMTEKGIVQAITVHGECCIGRGMKLVKDIYV